jgi:hypothetical protein
MSFVNEDFEKWTANSTDADSVQVMYKHEEYPLLLRIDRVEEFDGDFWRGVLKVTSDHEKHAHETLFETPILDDGADAEAFCQAIATAPMRYARTFFKQGKVKK